MFQHPSHSDQLAADLRLARTSVARRFRQRRASTDFERYAADVGHRVAADGIERTGADVTTVVALARSRGIGRRVADIAADPSQPAVARERALGRLLAALAADRGRARTSQPAA
jgi:hypothetical protein